MPQKIKITYFDTAMVLIEIGSIRLLTDPVLDPADTSYENGPVHLHKTGNRSIAFEKLGRIDAVLLSHDQHADNLDNAGRRLLQTVPLVLTTTEGAPRLKHAHAIGMEPWSSTKIKGSNGDEITVTAMPARHGPAGTEAATGQVTGFHLQRDGMESIYISGDTVPFEGTDQIASRFAPIGIALLNLGHVQLAPMGDLHFSMSAKEAVAFAASLRCGVLVPLHYEGWAHFTEGRGKIETVFLESKPSLQVRWLERGVTALFEI